MKYLFSYIFLFFSSTILYSQNNTGQNHIFGTTRDGNSTVSNAYLFLKNYPDFNCLSDSEGFFELRFPESLNNDTLVVSHLGFGKAEIAIKSIKNNPTMITLKSKIIVLDEITVKPEEDYLKNFFEKIVQNIPKNYPEKRHQMTGLFRKVSTNYEEFTHLVEAQVVMEDVGYKKDVKGAKIKVENYRESDDFSEIDSTFLLVLRAQENFHTFEEKNKAPSNPIIRLYEDNFIRKSYLEENPFNTNGYLNEFFGIEELPVYQRFLGYELVDNDTIYTIAYGTTDPPLGTTYIKVNSSDYAVVEFQVTRYMDPERELYEQFLMKYRKILGKYYPEKLAHKVLRFINRNVGSHQMDISTLWFDEVETENLKKLRSHEVLERDQRLPSNTFTYDQEFWKINKLTKEFPLDSAIIKSLEKNENLTNQFKRNGKD
jgi:hypothetical protein